MTKLANIVRIQLKHSIYSQNLSPLYITCLSIKPGRHRHCYHGSMTCEQQQNRPLNHIAISHPHAPRLSYLTLRAPHPVPICHLFDHCRGRSKMSHRHDIDVIDECYACKKYCVYRVVTFFFQLIHLEFSKQNGKEQE